MRQIATSAAGVLFALILVSVAMAAPTADVTPSADAQLPVLFQPEYGDFINAQAAAKKDGKPVYVLLGARWCLACEQLKKDIEFLGFLRALPHVVWLDQERHHPLAKYLLRKIDKSIPRLFVWHWRNNRWEGEEYVDAVKIRAFIKAEAAKQTPAKEPVPTLANPSTKPIVEGA
jgi:hypothetical protein